MLGQQSLLLLDGAPVSLGLSDRRGRVCSGLVLSNVTIRHRQTIVHSSAPVEIGEPPPSYPSIFAFAELRSEVRVQTSNGAALRVRLANGYR